MPVRNVKRNEIGQYWPYANKRSHDEARRVADRAVYGAIKSGRLVRQPCEVCGEYESEAHHDDYEQPLAVRWLCRSHHRAVHSGKSAVPVDKHDKYKRRSPAIARPLIVAVTKAIQDEMHAQGLTQRELSAMCGVAQPSASAWFSGGFKSIPTLVHAADALGCAIEIRFVKRARQSRVA